MTAVAIIGGGRWARVIASALQQVWAGQVVVCSPGNPNAWDFLPVGWRVEDLSRIWADPQISHVVIARRARDHAPTILAALEAGKAVLVEKPFCLTKAEANSILSLGGECYTGLVFLHAPNQARFRAAVLAAGQPDKIVVEWADPTAEERHGSAKSYDPALNVVQDVLPHVWSLVRPLVRKALTVSDVSISHGGQSVTLYLAGAASVTAHLRRHAPVRVRKLSVGGSGLSATIDFATEPGIANLNGASIDVFTGYSSPLAKQLRAFIRGPNHHLARVAAAVEALDLTLDTLPRIRAQQAEAIRAGTSIAGMREVMLGGIDGDGTPADRAEVARWLKMDEGDPAFNAAWTAGGRGATDTQRFYTHRDKGQ